MPVALSYPGVYVQEVSSGVHTVTSVSTSIGAFFGRAGKGPLNKAVRLLSPADFTRNFGDPHPMSDLAHSVRQFFANGGTDCYVVRLAKDARAAAVTLRNLNGQAVLDAKAKAEGVWANKLRLEVDYNTVNPYESFNLKVIREEGTEDVQTESYLNLSMNPGSPRFAPAFVTQSSTLIELKVNAAMGDPTLPGAFINTLANSLQGFSQGRRPLGGTAAAVAATLNGLINPVVPAAPRTSFEVNVNDTGWVNVTLSPWAPPAVLADMQTFIRDKIQDAVGGVAPGTTVTVDLTAVTGVGRLLTVTATSGAQSSVRVRQAASNDIAAALMLGPDQGGIEATRWSNFRPAPTATLLRLGNPATPGDLATINAVANLAQSDITQIAIDGTVIALNAGAFNLVTTVAADKWFVNAAAASSATDDNDGVREKLRIVAGAINARAGLAWRAEVWGHQLAIIARTRSVTVQPATIVTGTASTATPSAPRARARSAPAASPATTASRRRWRTTWAIRSSRPACTRSTRSICSTSW